MATTRNEQQLWVNEFVEDDLAIIHANEWTHVVKYHKSAETEIFGFSDQETWH